MKKELLNWWKAREVASFFDEKITINGCLYPSPQNGGIRNLQNSMLISYNAKRALFSYSRKALVD
ncbi:hypothetical protein Q0V21_28715 [Paenibacillus sp. 11B]|uniref:hypothetical protein n=1 Tax=Paenibacillus sp. 11B TaxID=3060965 RepID=UPI00264BBB8A|nr:hypothetical protein [Paenibacillus sp. 11B]MDN8592707.1 hypothetical protein [Paenibacillus sp. 11B]